MILGCCLPLAEKCVIKIKSKVKNHVVSSAFLTFSLSLIENTQASENRQHTKINLKKKGDESRNATKKLHTEAALPEQNPKSFLRP